MTGAVLLVVSSSAAPATARTHADDVPRPVYAPLSAPPAVLLRIPEAAPPGATFVLAPVTLAAPVPTPPATDVAPRGPVAASDSRAGFWGQLRDGLTVKGVASWYGGTRGYHGTVHVAMPGARYLVRGTATPRVRVCVEDACRTVRVVDSCACYWNTRDERVVDMSNELVAALGLAPSRGLYTVRITLVDG